MESEFISWLRRRLPTHPALLLGPGDDAAVLRWSAGANGVVTCDALTEGVDFLLNETDPRRIGRKALGVNLSDLAAMAARPLAVVISLILPRSNALELATQLYEGLLPLAEEMNVAIAGGDTNTWDGGLVINVTAIGETTAKGPLRRGGALPGDAIVVTGEFGGSILGKHLDFMPRVKESLYLNEHFSLHAGADVSDGLELDLWHIAAESGCGVLLEPAAIPIAAAAQQLAKLRNDGVSPETHARTDGEDFELVLAVPPEEVAAILQQQTSAMPLTRIGYFVQEKGFWQRDSQGVKALVSPRGYRH